MWELETGKQLQNLVGHESGILDIAYSPDGQTALSSASNELMLWDLETGMQLNKLTIPGGAIHSVAFRSDGKAAMSCSFDGFLAWWHIHSRSALLDWIYENRAVIELDSRERKLFGIESK